MLEVEGVRLVKVTGSPGQTLVTSVEKSRATISPTSILIVSDVSVQPELLVIINTTSYSPGVLNT